LRLGILGKRWHQTPSGKLTRLLVSLPLPAMPTDVVEFKKEKCSIFSHPDLCPTSEFNVMIANE